MNDPAIILVVDDSADNRTLLDLLLRSQGYDVVMALSGLEALDITARQSVDMVLLDILMPGMDGLEVCRRMRSIPATRFLPIVAVTALGGKADRIAAMAAGADDYLEKPIDRTELLTRVKACLRLKAQKDELDQLRADFTAMLVHDLRSPLTTLQAALILFEDGKRLGEIDNALLSRLALSAVAKMRGLIDGILDVARLESGQLSLVVEAVEPVEVLKEVAEQAQVLADARRLRLVRSWPDTLPALSADRQKLAQILANLVDNALKFARTEIRLSARDAGAGMEIRVEDDGPGVEESDYPILFETWVQTKTGRTTGQGTGLGLASVKLLVEAHTGPVTAERPPDGGIAFAVRLPYQVVAVQA